MSWPTVKLGDIAPSRPLKLAPIENNEEVWLLNLDMVESQSGRIINKVVGAVDEAGSSTHWFSSEHVLYSKLRPYLNKVVLPDSHGLATTELVPMLPDPTRLDRRYLAHYLRSEKFVNWVSEQVAGAKMPRVSMKIFWDHEIPLPPLAEQKRIATILDKADVIRQKRKQAIDLADEFLRSVFLDMFGDPVTNPKGWEVKRFGDLGDWASGGTPSRSVTEYFEGDIDWYSARELNERYLNNSIEKITDEALKNSAAKIFPKGSLLVGMYDTAAFKISILGKDSASNQACANVIPNALVDVEWLYSFIQFSKETYLRQRRGVRQKNLNLGMIKDFELPLPPRTEQLQFANIVKQLMKADVLNKAFDSSSEKMFDSLSQKAFSGKL
ncbi:restriction endonuclease subunit S [Vibrio sp. 10N.286.54.B2]|uniref:restriction endonuclease subunit S n=1 Tax=Vibrio sp. 10N.286.54.B2 TaxID=3229718 RepID=UPI00354C0746